MNISSRELMGKYSAELSLIRYFVNCERNNAYEFDELYMQILLQRGFT